MPEKFRRHFLKTREAVVLLNKALEKLVVLRQIVEARVDVELIQTEFAEIYLINGKPILAKLGENVFPTLVFSEFLASSPKVFIDMGAVPHVCNGANVMAPGITRFDGEFKKGDFVLVADEKHGKPLAIGEVIYDVDAAKTTMQGVVVKNVHFVGDRIWNFLKQLEAKAL
jgi:PUA domain protein